MYDTVHLAERGIPTVLICTEPFRELAEGQGVILGRMRVPLAIIPHPLASLSEEGELRDRALAAAQQILSDLWPAASALPASTGSPPQNDK